MHKEWHCVCDCGSYEHQMHFNYWEDTLENGRIDRNMSLSIHLVDVPFWRRLKKGLAYIFGHKSRFGEFDEIILGKRDAKTFLEVAEKLNAMEDYDE